MQCGTMVGIMLATGLCKAGDVHDSEESMHPDALSRTYPLTPVTQHSGLLMLADFDYIVPAVEFSMHVSARPCCPGVSVSLLAGLTCTASLQAPGTSPSGQASLTVRQVWQPGQ